MPGSDGNASYKGLRAASSAATSAAKGSSRKRDTAPEMLLRRACHRRGLRYVVDDASLPGRPDMVFRSGRVAVFVDGDFWHGRDLAARLERLARGHNAGYWIAKIKGNVERDRRNDRLLTADGWRVLRFWERDLKGDAAEAAADAVWRAVRGSGPT